MNTDRRFVNRRERSIGDKFWAAFVRQGRRKSDPPKLFEPAPIAVGVLLLAILVGAVLLTGCVTLGTHKLEVEAAKLEQSMKCWTHIEKIIRVYEQKLCEAERK